MIITGGSGHIGTALAWKLLQNNYQVVSLDLEPPRSRKVMFVEADVSEGIPAHTFLEKPTYIINLAGAPIFGRWTGQKKEEIYNSRVQGTINLVEFIRDPKFRPQALVSASATGYYGDSGTVNVDERSDPGEGFLARICQDWENQAREAEKLGVRTTIVRNGHVISSDGIIKILRPFTKLKIIPQSGPGQACLPWIHIDDLVNIYLQAMTEAQAPRVINAVAPQISTYGEFNRCLADLTSAWVLKIPLDISRAIIGDLATEMAFSQCVKSESISTRYNFKYRTLQSALKNVLAV